MTLRLILVLVLTLSVGLVTAAPAEDGHNHSEEEERHSDEEERAPEADHDEEGALELTPEAVRMAGIRLATAGHGRIGTAIDVPGEVGFDEDRLVHVVPSYAGVAQEVHFRVGERVRADDVVAIVEGNESLNRYSITSPISGWVIEKHVTPGEFVSDESPIYVIADLSRVWVNLAIYPKDADKIAAGQKVTLRGIGMELFAEGTIEYLTPVLDARTRTMTARIVLPNPGNAWRPGTFVHGEIVVGRGPQRLLVEKDAVQILDDEQVVFLPEGAVHFRPVPVKVGESDARFVEILGGLDEGTQYVAAGAFELKAKIVTSALDGHAGHGHKERISP